MHLVNCYFRYNKVPSPLVSYYVAVFGIYPMSQYCNTLRIVSAARISLPQLFLNVYSVRTLQ